MSHLEALIPFFIRFFIKLLLVLAFLIIALFLLLFIFQRKLLYFPQEANARTLKAIEERYPKANFPLKVNQLKTQIKTQLKTQAYFIEQNSGTTLLYFGGNAEDVSDTLLHVLSKYPYHLATVVYPGYGQSEGKPSEKIIYEQALALYDHLNKTKKLKKVIVMGRSLGTGVATYLASKRKVDKVILISPYDSILNIAKKQFKMLPIGILLKDRFLAETYAKEIKAPLLAIYTPDDQVVKKEHSKALIQAWKGSVQVMIKKHYTHNNLLYAPDLKQEIEAFIIKP